MTQTLIETALLEQLVGALEGLARLAELHGDNFPEGNIWHCSCDTAELALTAGRAAIDGAERVEREPIFTTGHCKEKQKPGGCQLHNLQCGYPKCDRGPTIDLGRYAGTYGGYIKKEQPRPHYKKP